MTLLIAMALLQDPSAADLLRQADELFVQRRYEDALARYRQAVDKAAAAKSAPIQVESLAQAARCFGILRKPDEAKAWLAKAAALANPEEPMGWSRYLGVRGIHERDAGDSAKARATFEEMYEYCTRRELHRRAIDAIHHLALVVPPAEQPAWALKGIAAAEKLKDEAWLAVLWNNLGATYEDLKQYDKMLDAYRKAREYHHRTGGPRQKMIADWAVGHGCRLAGRLEEAEEWAAKALEAAKKLHAAEPDSELLEWVGLARKELGQAKAARGDKAGAVPLLKEARAAMVEAGLEKHWPEMIKEVDELLRSLEK